MNLTRPITITVVATLILSVAYSQNIKSVAARLGYNENATMLILHADDAGVSHSVNMATISAFTKQGIYSASIMVPCPWFPEIAAYLRSHPLIDAGLHLTLTAEWQNYKWGGVAPQSKIPTLLNIEGYFYDNVADVITHANPDEVEIELRAQIDRAIAFGVKPTHLDSHMGVLFASPGLFMIYQKLGKEYQIPVFIPDNMLSQYPEMEDIVDSNIIRIDYLYMMNANVGSEKWQTFYEGLITKLKPGVNEIIVHLGYDNQEMKGITFGHPDFGSQWRQQDYNVMVSDGFREALKANDIHLINWRQIQSLIYPAGN